MSFNSPLPRPNPSACSHCGNSVPWGEPSITWDITTSEGDLAQICFHPSCARDFLLAFSVDVFTAQRALFRRHGTADENSPQLEGELTNVISVRSQFVEDRHDQA